MCIKESLYFFSYTVQSNMLNNGVIIMILYHGTRVCGKQAKINVSEFPKAKPALNGYGFYLTNNKDIALEYGSLIEYEVDTDWSCKLMRTIELNELRGLEYVLTQAEADALVVDHALSITTH